MKSFLRPLALVTAIVVAQPAHAADLAKIDRTIKTEPAYQSKPTYCLLVFGPEANTRVWLVVDGDVLYMDRNGNGDLTEAGKRVTRDRGKAFKAGDIFDGPTRYRHLWVSDDEDSVEIIIWCRSKDGDRRLFAGFDGPGKLRFADRPGTAPVIHFNGPLTAGFFLGHPDGTSELRLDKLGFVIGTVGLGNGTFAKFGFSRSETFSATAEIEFQEKGKDKSIRAKVNLTGTQG